MVTLNTAIRNAQIQEGTITYKHFDATNTPSGSYIIKWTSDEDKFEWIPNGGITVNEAPSGSINGVNKTFTLSQTPIEGTEQVYLNGLLQEPGSSNDYTISGNTITFVDAPETDDILLVTYVTAQAFDYEEYTTPPLPSYGYIAGGHSNSTLSNIERIAFPFDSGIASVVGNLSNGRHSSGGCNSSEYGYVSGGYSSSDVSIIDRFQFPFDSGTAAHVGNLSESKNGIGACNSSVAGYVFGGEELSTIEKFSFPFDSGTASKVGNLTISANSAAYNSSTHGYSLGGDAGVAGNSSAIDRIVFPFNSGTSTHVGNLTYSGWGIAGANSSTHGYSFGIFTGSTRLSVIERILFPFNSGTASHVGNLSGSRDRTAANNSTLYGYASVGLQPSYIFLSLVDRITFPFDSGTASHVGNTSATKDEAVGIDNVDFVSMFV